MINNERRLESLRLMAKVVVPNASISPERMTIRQFCTEYVRITGVEKKPIEYSSIVADTLISNNIQPSVKINGNPYYSKYDFVAISQWDYQGVIGKK